MNGCRISLEPDEDDRAVWLITESANQIRQKDLVWLREGFGIHDVREALMATGWVRQDGDDLRFTNVGDSLFGRTLSTLLEDIFSYFSAPGNPTDELREVRSAVAEFEDMCETIFEIPLYAYAWLDIMVREDVADEARSAKDVWSTARVAIECDRLRERRVKELLARYSQPATRTVGPMARSLPTRNPAHSRETKTG